MERNERKEAARKLAATISKMSDTERAAMAARMPVVTVEGRTLSVFNCCLVSTQCPSATVVGGFKQWLAAGRAVRKGEHGYSIWVPCGKKGDGEQAEGEKPFFMLGTVFDVSQTQEIEMQVAA